MNSFNKDGGVCVMCSHVFFFCVSMSSSAGEERECTLAYTRYQNKGAGAELQYTVALQFPKPFGQLSTAMAVEFAGVTGKEGVRETQKMITEHRFIVRGVRQRKFIGFSK